MITTSTVSETMSFREKTAWVCFLTTLAVWIPYFAYVLQLFERNELAAAPVIGAFITAVVVQVLLAIVAAIAISIRSRQKPKDERDVAIESKSYKNAYFILGFSCIFAVGWIIMQLLTPTAISQMVLFCLVLAETTKYGTQVVCYRRGV